ncbi:hypothetical protein FOA43_000212 [Brettanomyces nanus]|uniref:Uncharacterized protein n=1 Tax=Eeniella nana TaxID=13502 RepID=A0A875RZ10_EENNA|nr:uncharacterized protein FOA43_000212 [Brettanomyces nanus]QPG72909.1 hypothetical protein FOA43_000212 [Brettanomyces nanus]
MFGARRFSVCCRRLRAVEPTQNSLNSEQLENVIETIATKKGSHSEQNSDLNRHLHHSTKGSKTRSGNSATRPFGKTLFRRRISNFDGMAQYISLANFNDSIDKVPNVYPELKNVIFSPGVHYMQDPRTKRINFSPSLLDIPHVDDFKFDKVNPFISPSHDSKLLEVANAHNCSNTDADDSIRYYSSTSSLTGILRQFHLLLSNNRPLDTSFLSKSFPSVTTMSPSSRFPVCSVVTPKQVGSESIFSIDSDRSADTELILSCLGNVIELMLTTDKDTFSKYLKGSPDDPEASGRDSGSAYHYAKFGKFLMRSQLDAKDKELPGTGVFDLKTRAVCAIRYDISHTDFFPTNYEINRTEGLYESFEREIFEMAKIVMFKYGLQARIGNMDGILVAYHNVKNILGFQYFPLSVIDDIFFGHTDASDIEIYKTNRSKGKPDEEKVEKKLKGIVNDIGLHWQNKREALSSLMAKHEFKVSLTILQDLLDILTAKSKGKPFRMIVKYCNGDTASETSGDIEVIANIIDEKDIDRLTLLGDQKLQQDKEELSESQKNASNELLPSDRIKKMSRNGNFQRKRFERLNGQILDKSYPNGTFMFQITCKHFFDGTLCQQKYPTPSLKILDKNDDFEWEIQYKIDEISDKKFIKERYFKNVSRIAMHSFASASSNTAPTTVPTGLEEHYLDTNASFYQNVLRAYSDKAVKRSKLFKRSPFSKGRNA